MCKSVCDSEHGIEHYSHKTQDRDLHIFGGCKLDYSYNPVRLCIRVYNWAAFRCRSQNINKLVIRSRFYIERIIHKVLDSMDLSLHHVPLRQLELKKYMDNVRILNKLIDTIITSKGISYVESEYND